MKWYTIKRRDIYAVADSKQKRLEIFGVNCMALQYFVELE